MLLVFQVFLGLVGALGLIISCKLAIANSLRMHTYVVWGWSVHGLPEILFAASAILLFAALSFKVAGVVLGVILLRVLYLQATQHGSHASE
ncbi:MAG: hypothetical protein Q8Q39_04430 [bacterium]|nr:hypothetical protein [bacterium]